MSTSPQKISTGTVERPDLPRSALGQYLPMAVALVVALGSTVTLAAFDKPLDRHALIPSVIECAEANTETSSSLDPHPQLVQQADTTAAHAMLLRYDLQPGGTPARVEGAGGARSSLL